ncbi:hypothetical protein RRG08_032989 [Elysia crispata]|uniref:Uncharacterized protein n=1 Tax=Elysia crispata TaxID=231223 RepID=A0AAE1D3M1_9GAST|nr:hypothetical protein RRG08_032989 [Elysia crispata]
MEKGKFWNPVGYDMRNKEEVKDMSSKERLLDTDRRNSCGMKSRYLSGGPRASGFKLNTREKPEETWLKLLLALGTSMRQ